MENHAQHILDTDQTAFQADVIEASNNQLVIVDFWAEWCGPCRSLGPILESIVHEFNGAVRLVKVNADEQQELCGHYGIRSLPTVFLFLQGEVVDHFMGLQTESAIKEMIARHLEGPGAGMLEQIQSAYDQGYKEEAMTALRQMIEQDPNNDKLKLKLMNWLAENGQLDEAETLSAAISAEGRESPEFKQFTARLSFSEASNGDGDLDALRAAIESDPDDLESRLQLANQLVLANEFPEALDQLLEIIRKDRSFNDEAPRQTMIKIFELLGNQGEIVSSYRRQLGRLLY